MPFLSLFLMGGSKASDGWNRGFHTLEATLPLGGNHLVAKFILFAYKYNEENTCVRLRI